jgi:hypothetical protein
MLSDEDMRARMSKGWRAGYPETECGNGSLRRNSILSRAAIPQWCEKYGISKVCDAGAGDLHYARGIAWNVEYSAFDLFPRWPEVTEIDITTQALPQCDAILCRMVLNHLDRPRIEMALEQFQRSSLFLMATQFNGEDLPQRSTQFMRLDLRDFGLGEPLEQVQDGAEAWCSLALWEL